MKLLPVAFLCLLLVLATASSQTPIGKTSTEDPPAKDNGVPFGGYVVDGPPQCPKGKTATLWGFKEEGPMWAAIYQCV